MNRDTVAFYDANASRWASKKRPVRHRDAGAFAAAVRDRGLRIDVGSGPGRYTRELGDPIVALDASIEMLKLTHQVAPDALGLMADLTALPLRSRAVAGAWAAMSYHHIERELVPMALADLHDALELGAPLDITMADGDYVGTDLPGDSFPGRFFACWTRERLVDVLIGAGFDIDKIDIVDEDQAHVVARRARTLADIVGPDMRVLLCGLNPSIYAADAGVGFARPGNRFWPAAIEAGLVRRDRDARHALTAHGIGFTDLVKRATTAASDLNPGEYRDGAERVCRLVEWLQPKAVCFVGLAGYRAAIDKKATAGWQTQAFGGRPAYVMPSTSGLNAATPMQTIVAHLAATLAPPEAS